METPLFTLEEWVEGSRYGRDPVQITNELLRIKAANNGDLKPEAIVEAARKKRSILHNLFEWDDTVAAEKWRIHQARMLVVSVRKRPIYEDGEGEPMRAFVSVRKESGRSYERLEVAMSTPDLRDQVLTTALSELRIWKRRYEKFNELAKFFEAIELAEAEMALT